MNGVFGEIRMRRLQRQGRLHDVLRLDPVGDVDDPGRWRKVQDHPFHDPDKGIVQTEIGYQGYNSTHPETCCSDTSSILT